MKNVRTIASTIVAVLAYLNVVIAQFDTSILEGHPNAQLAYRVMSYIFAGGAWLNSHYFNQDFTGEGCEGTGYTRYLKAVKEVGAHELDQNVAVDEEGETWVG